jgi:hypothetical protein
MTVAAALTKTGMIIPCIAGDVMEWTHNGTTFKQTGGTVGMNNLVMLDEANAIGDWISSSIDSFTDVDVSDDGVRKGATMAVLMLEIVTSSGSVPSLRTMRKGGTSHTGRYQTGAASAMMDAHAALDNNGVFQAKFASSWSSSQNIASVVAYYI